MSDCVKEMTEIERNEYLINNIENVSCPVLLYQWEKDLVKSALRSQVNFLKYARNIGYQPTIETINNIPPSTGSSIQYRAKILGEWVKTKGEVIRESNESLVNFLYDDTDFQYDGLCSLCNKNTNGCCAELNCKDEVIKSLNERSTK